MKKIAILALVLIGCAKTSPEPTSSTQTNTTTVKPKYVEIYISYGSTINLATVKWSYVPEIDSSYGNNGAASRTIRNYTLSDSIIVYTNSGVFSYDNITIVVDGVIKDKYSLSQTEKVIKLK